MLYESDGRDEGRTAAAFGTGLPPYAGFYPAASVSGGRLVRVPDLHPSAIVWAVKARVVLSDDTLEAELASYLRIEERGLEAGGLS